MDSLPLKTLVKTLGMHKPFALLLMSAASYIIFVGAYPQRIQAQEMICSSDMTNCLPLPTPTTEKTYGRINFYDFGSTTELRALRITSHPLSSVEPSNTLQFPSSDLFPEGLSFRIEHKLFINEIINRGSGTYNLRAQKIPYKLVMEHIPTHMPDKSEQLYSYDLTALDKIFSDHCYEMVNLRYHAPLYRYTPSLDQCSSDPSLDLYNWAEKIWEERFSRPSPPPIPRKIPVSGPGPSRWDDGK